MKKQILKSFPLDEETQNAIKILTEKGFNISFLLREFLKQEAHKQASKA